MLCGSTNVLYNLGSGSLFCLFCLSGCLGTLAVQMPTPEDRLPRFFFFFLLLLFFVWSPGLPPALSDCPGRDYRAYMGVQPAVVVLVVVVVSFINGDRGRGTDEPSGWGCYTAACGCRCRCSAWWSVSQSVVSQRGKVTRRSRDERDKVGGVMQAQNGEIQAVERLMSLSGLNVSWTLDRCGSLRFLSLPLFLSLALPLSFLSLQLTS